MVPGSPWLHDEDIVWEVDSQTMDDMLPATSASKLTESQPEESDAESCQ